MGERDEHAFLKEYRERMAPVWANLEECRMIIAELERRVDELEDARRRGRRPSPSSL